MCQRKKKQLHLDQPDDYSKKQQDREHVCFIN